MPDRIYRTPDGQSRLLIRRAMAGMVPPQVLDNPRRGLQGADIHQRLLNTAEEIGATLARFYQSPYIGSYLDLHQLQALWRSLEHTVPTTASFKTTVIITQAIAAGLFLEQLDARTMG